MKISVLDRSENNLRKLKLFIQRRFIQLGERKKIKADKFVSLYQ